MGGRLRERKQEKKLEDMMRGTGGYLGANQMMFLQDYFRTGRIQDPFASPYQPGGGPRSDWGQR